MYGGGIGNLDVFLWPREEKDNYLMWRVSGDQGDAWMKAGVDVGYTGESQVSRKQNCKGYVKLFCVAGTLISCLIHKKVLKGNYGPEVFYLKQKFMGTGFQK